MSNSSSTKPFESEMKSSMSEEKNKQWQREFLMERLRSHSTQHKGFNELSKAIRMSMLEKRYALDAVEKSNLQKCLDNMQHCIKVTTRQGLIERLESLSRQLGLKFMEDSSGLFISSDMFFLEIILDANGTLSDVKVHHECKIEQQSCSELVTCLVKGDFADFTNQLEGLSSIYQLNAEPKVKSKAFVALQAMETDLYNLFKWQNFHKDIPTMLIKSPVGIVQQRRGGHPMKLTYFVSPYDLLSLDNKTLLPLSIELLKNKDIGLNVTVNLEASSTNKLQILPSITFSKEVNTFPVYSPLTATNSALLPATYVLRLNKALPMCNNLLRSINQTPDVTTTKDSSYILNLTVQAASKGEIQNCSKGLFVSLPDQNHCYFFTENINLQGTLLTNVPFTEPSKVSKILAALKQQALFYTFIASCVRTNGKLCNIENTIMLEVNALSLYKISVALQHSNEDSMVSVEFDLSDLSNITVKLYSLLSVNNYELYNQKLSKVAQASYSIPITIRFLLKLWEQEQMQLFHHHRPPNIENGKFESSGRSINDTTTNGGNNIIGRSDFCDSKIKYDRNSGTGTGLNNNNMDTSSYSLNNSRQQFYNSVNMPPSSDVNFTDSNNMTGNGGGSGGNLLVNKFGIQSEHHEDFCKSPKSEIQINSIINNLELSDLNSLGQRQRLQTANTSLNSNVTATSSASLPSLTIERVKYPSSKPKTMDSTMNSELWQQKKTTTDSKNIVSITPVLSNTPETVVSTKTNPNGLLTNEPEKRSEIEIIPIPHNVLTSISILPINSSEKQTNSSNKKKIDDKDNSQHKTEKKRRKREGSSSSSSSPVSRPDKVEMKIIELLEPSTLSIPKQGPSNISRKPSLSAISYSKKLLNKASSVSSSNQRYPSSIGTINKNISSNSRLTTSSASGSSSVTGGGKPSLMTLKTATVSSPSPNISVLSKDNTKDKITTIKNNKRYDKIIEKPVTDCSYSNRSLVEVEKLNSQLISAATNSKIYSFPSDQYLLENECSDNDQTADMMSFGGHNDTTNLFQSKFRKHGSLSAVINKLKQAQSYTGGENINMDILDTNTQQQLESVTPQNISNKTPSSYKAAETSSKEFLTNKSNNSINSGSEYMIKPSLDGMKLTINKTRSIENYIKRDKIQMGVHKLSSNSSSSTTSSSSSNRPQSPNKKHTGLKPGVSSGPASKSKSIPITYTNRCPPDKPKTTIFNKNESNKCHFYKANSSECLPLTKDNIIGLASGSGGIKGLSKSLSSNNLNTSSSATTSSAGQLRKEKFFIRTKVSSPNSEKYSNSLKVHSPIEGGNLKSFQQQQSPVKTKNAMEGLIKSLNTNFQIPKLSAKASISSEDLVYSKNKEIITNSVTTKPSGVQQPNDPTSEMNLDVILSDKVKQPLQSTTTDIGGHLKNLLIPDDNHKIDDKTNMKTKLCNNTSTTEFSAKICKTTNSLNENLINHETTTTTAAPATSTCNDFKIMTTSNTMNSESNIVVTTTTNNTNIYDKFYGNYSSNPVVVHKTTPQHYNTTTTSSPAAAAVSMRIIKSPVPSPVLQSPLAATTTTTSPCIDDELMDEALIGLGNK